MIIDALAHVTADGRWFSTSLDASESALLRQMDAARIDRAVICGLAGYGRAEDVLTAYRHHRDRFIPVCGVDPTAPAPGPIWEWSDEAPVGVKLHPRLNRYDALDPRVLSYLDDLSSLEVRPVVWICSFLHAPPLVPRKPPVESLYELVARYPKLSFVLAHAGGADILRLAQAVRGCSNAFLDLSFTLTRFAGSSVETDIAYLINTFERRLLFGSDFPEVSLSDALAEARRLASTSKGGAEERLLGENLSELIRSRI